MADTTGTDDREAENLRGHVPQFPWLYPVGLILLGLVYLAVGRYYHNHTFNLFTEWNVEYIIWTIGAVHFALGYRQEDIEYVMGVYFLGIPLYQLSGGSTLVPWFIFSTTRDSLETYGGEYPDEPEKIWHGDDSKEKMPDGMKPPFRIAFSDPRTDGYPWGITDAGIERTSPLHKRTTNEGSYIIRWRILNEFDFRRNVRSAENADHQLEDYGASFLSQNLTKMTPAVALANLDVINEKFDEWIRQKTASWGVDIVDAKVKAISMSHGLNSAVQDVAKASAAADASVHERDTLTRQGEGRANARRAEVQAEIDGRTAGLKNMTETLGIEGRDALAADVARTIGTAPSTKIVIGTEGFKDLTGIGAAIAESMKSSATPPAPTPPASPAKTGT